MNKKNSISAFILILSSFLSFGQTAKIPYSNFSNSLEFKGQLSFMNEANTAPDHSNWYWCVSPFEDKKGKIHLFMSRWPDGDGMKDWMSTCEFAHFVGDKPEGPFTFVSKIMDNKTVPASWMKSPHNIRIKKVDNMYVIVFIVQDSRVGNVKGQKTCLMTSKSLNGPWTPVGTDGVVVQPSTDPSHWTYNSSIGCDNPDFDKINGKYYVYFKAGVAPDGRMHYGYAVANKLKGPYIVCDKPITDNVSYLEDATTFSWDGERYLLTTDNHGGNTGVFGAGILWKSDVKGEFGPFHLSNAKIGFKLLSDYTPIPPTSSYCYGTVLKFERPAVLMRKGKPAYFYAPNTCNFLGTGRPGIFVFKNNANGE